MLVKLQFITPPANKSKPLTCGNNQAGTAAKNIANKALAKPRCEVFFKLAEIARFLRRFSKNGCGLCGPDSPEISHSKNNDHNGKMLVYFDRYSIKPCPRHRNRTAMNKKSSPNLPGRQ
jgi:hypothetical protein